MNTELEALKTKALAWAADDPVHPRTEGRFAKHADGKVERRDGAV